MEFAQCGRISSIYELWVRFRTDDVRFLPIRLASTTYCDPMTEDEKLQARHEDLLINIRNTEKAIAESKALLERSNRESTTAELPPCDEKYTEWVLASRANARYCAARTSPMRSSEDDYSG